MSRRSIVRRSVVLAATGLSAGGAIGHHSGSPAGMWRQDAVVEHQIDPWPRRECRQLLKQFERLNTNWRVRPPRPPSGQHDAPIVQEPEPLLRHRRPQQIAAELLQARAIRSRRVDIGVEIEAIEVRVPRRRREHPRRVRIGPHPPHARPRAGAERNAALDRGTADAGQSRTFLDHGSARNISASPGLSSRRRSRRCTRGAIRASTAPTASSVGGGSGRKSSAPVTPLAKKTPSSMSVWKWTLRFNPPPKR